ncbi:MAG: potassium transporter TrkA, partial [Alphaproteobacteria bacterium]|nr:potassium transporter TrkA [Alphaproteobacteria bacterium]
NNRNNVERFKELNVFVVRRATAIVSLLDHYVRSPSAVTLLLGDDSNNDVIDVEIKNPDLVGVSLRQMQFPTDIMFLSVCRKGKQLNVHNYYRFREGDIITMAGSNKSLKTMSIYLSIHGWASAVEMHGIA